MTNDSVIIVGAGPTGVAAALALSRLGIAVTVLEAEHEPNMSPRAVVYLHPILPDLERLGVLERMKQQGHVDREGFNLHLIALGERISAPNSVLDGHTPTPFNIHMGQGEFTTIAIEELSRRGGVDVNWGTRVLGIEQDARGVDVTIERDGVRSKLRAGWVIGADGARSVVREHIGGTLEGTTWDERFIAINLYTDYRSRGFFSSNLYAHPTLGTVIAQINAAGLWRTTIQEDASLDLEGAEQRIHDFLRALLGEGAEYEIDAFQPYKMHQRLSTRMREGRVLLAGDAAHLTNPTGGLGLTSGLYDVYALEQVLPAVIGGTADESALDRYAASRSEKFREVASPAASMLKRIVYGNLPLDELREITRPLRETNSTPEGQLKGQLGMDGLRSPSLI